MKIDYVSDLHFNHWMTWTNNQLKWETRTKLLTQRLLLNKQGEVLVIAGDFGEWNNQALWILEECSRHYERVYFTFGNHDLYLLNRTQTKKYNDSLGRLNELIEKASKINNVIPLVKTVDVYKGKIFAGDAMWYLPKNLRDWEFLRNVSNDYNYVKVKRYSRDGTCKKLHKESMDWYETLENVNIDVFVSHVPPVNNPYSPFEPNTCYMVDLPFINTNHWICGHQHIQRSFKKADVNFYMNAIGYSQDYSNYVTNSIPLENCDEYKSFGVKTFEI